MPTADVSEEPETQYVVMLLTCNGREFPEVSDVWLAGSAAMHLVSALFSTQAWAKVCVF